MFPVAGMPLQHDLASRLGRIEIDMGKQPVTDIYREGRSRTPEKMLIACHLPCWIGGPCCRKTAADRCLSMSRRHRHRSSGMAPPQYVVHPHRLLCHSGSAEILAGAIPGRPAVEAGWKAMPSAIYPPGRPVRLELPAGPNAGRAMAPCAGDSLFLSAPWNQALAPIGSVLPVLGMPLQHDLAWWMVRVEIHLQNRRSPTLTGKGVAAHGKNADVFPEVGRMVGGLARKRMRIAGAPGPASPPSVIRMAPSGSSSSIHTVSVTGAAARSLASSSVSLSTPARPVQVQVSRPSAGTPAVGFAVRHCWAGHNGR